MGPSKVLRPLSDARRLAPALDWIEVAAPQQNAALLAEIPGAIEIEVFGAVTRPIKIGTGDVVVRVQCDAHDLVLWATQRASLADVAQVTGPVDAVAATSRLHVF